ncbi:hypothetical protein PIB30_021853 [Stylosanthes scabra]|uniref:Uncharacterized protein n=1 Tax=Stylosanthes scabra TaxID=79078 RepID=A0ABU6ZAP9_9FABA|nr:hypothetical protein [Stylosanthes scabra]
MWEFVESCNSSGGIMCMWNPRCILGGLCALQQKGGDDDMRRWTMCFLAVVWVVWNCRNNRIFRGVDHVVQKAIDNVVTLVEKWEYEWRLKKNYHSGKGI